MPLVSAGGVVALVSTDMLVQDSHFRLDWSTPPGRPQGDRPRNAADIEAIGRRPPFVVGFGAPAETPAAGASALVGGMWEEAGRIGAGIVGGDLASTAAVGGVGHRD